MLLSYPWYERMFDWLSYIGEVLYCHVDERSAEGPSGSGMHCSEAESKCHRTVTHAVMTEFKWRYNHNRMYGVKIYKPATNHRFHTN